MAVLPNTRLETHPDGTVGVVSIIGGNWERLEALFGSGLATSDPSYNLFASALLRAAVPATNGAVIEWREVTTPKRFVARAGTSTSTGAALAVDFQGPKKYVLTLNGNVTFTTSNRADGWQSTVIVKADASVRNLTFPAWVFVGAAAPATIAANKTAVLELWCNGVNDTDIVARWTVQP
jgi:hypothetical protein